MADLVPLDITGVPIMDFTVAKHLWETVTAARLLRAEVMIVGTATRIGTPTSTPASTHRASQRGRSEPLGWSWRS